jgi:predicted transcriptional regulator
MKPRALHWPSRLIVNALKDGPKTLRELEDIGATVKHLTAFRNRVNKLKERGFIGYQDGKYFVSP